MKSLSTNYSVTIAILAGILIGAVGMFFIQQNSNGIGDTFTTQGASCSKGPDCSSAETCSVMPGGKGCTSSCCTFSAGRSSR